MVYVNKTKNKYYLSFIIFLLILAVILLAVLHRPPAKEYGSEQFLMDTLVSIKAYGNNSVILQDAVEDAFAEMRRIAELTDRYPSPGTQEFLASDICKLNKKAGQEPVELAPDVFIMLSAAKKYHEMTNGAFDVTIGPLLDTWGFGLKEDFIPTPENIEKARSLVDIQGLVLSERDQTAFLVSQGMSVDLGGIAKGYAVERAAFMLQQHGIKNAIINAGGNIRVLGGKDKTSAWKIGIQDPRNPAGLVATLSLRDESAVTSGDYRRFFIRNGKRYHHIISPQTGYPAENHMSVTILTRDSTLADILSTALFIMPAGEALALVEETAGVEALFITADKKIIPSSGLADKLEIIKGKDYVYDESR